MAAEGYTGVVATQCCATEVAEGSALWRWQLGCCAEAHWQRELALHSSGGAELRGAVLAAESWGCAERGS